MAKATESLQANWIGPYAWPDYETIAESPPLPSEAGVYLHTYPHSKGLLIYLAGITRRPFADRHREHTRKYHSGDYTILSMSAVFEGKREEVWQGWGWTPEKRSDFAEREAKLREAADQQLASCQIFVAVLGTAPRILERVEAAVMESLYQQPTPISTLPDRGMHLAPRWPDESPIVLENIVTAPILGLEPKLEI